MKQESGTLLLTSLLEDLVAPRTSQGQTKKTYKVALEKIMEEASTIRSLVVYSRTISRRGIGLSVGQWEPPFPTWHLAPAVFGVIF